MVEETAEDKFKPTPFSYAIGDESTKVRASLQAATYQYIAAGHNLPVYLAKTQYKEPTDANVNNYLDSDPDGLNFLGRLQKNPAYFEAFTGHMEAWTAWKTPWTKVYDTTRLLDGAKLSDTSPCVVDVGGNTGIDISHVLTKHPDLPAGSLVLQDLPEALLMLRLIRRSQLWRMIFPFPSLLNEAAHTSCTPSSTTGQITNEAEVA